MSVCAENCRSLAVKVIGKRLFLGGCLCVKINQNDLYAVLGGLFNKLVGRVEGIVGLGQINTSDKIYHSQLCVTEVNLCIPISHTRGVHIFGT